MTIRHTKVQFQINVASQINAGGVYFKFDSVDPAFIWSPAFNQENTVIVADYE